MMMERMTPTQRAAIKELLNRPPVDYQALKEKRIKQEAALKEERERQFMERRRNLAIGQTPARYDTCPHDVGRERD